MYVCALWSIVFQLVCVWEGSETWSQTCQGQPQCSTGFGSPASCVPKDHWVIIRDVTFSSKLSPKACLLFPEHLFVYYLLLSNFVWWIVLFLFFSITLLTEVSSKKMVHKLLQTFSKSNLGYWSSQRLLRTSWLNERMDSAKMGFLALEKCFFCASKGTYLKIIQNCRQLNWFLLKVGTDLIVKWRISPTAFQHLQ